ncbi:uncharacterized protein LOC123322301 [Coccinella septempunctata]|uniref:uncharacterized protein LOC123322301 n=1 Tax=Coccinella septempunctata TaxID=41139 RepID=UPI001D078506|nr:uncharacterized protein LOC123322301 [Coccinella septempunctata]
MGFFANIKHTYGSEAHHLLKKLFNDTMKLAAIKNRRIFLLQCRYKTVFPKHITNNIGCLLPLQTEKHPFKKNVDEILNKLKKSALNIEIDITEWKYRQLLSSTRLQRGQLKLLLPESIFVNTLKAIETKFNVEFERIKRGNIRKIEDLLRNTADVLVADGNGFIHNYTQTVLPGPVQRILSLGPQFGLPLSNSEIPIHSVIKDLEYCIHNCQNDETEKNRIRAFTTNILTNFCRQHVNLKSERRLMKEVNETKHFLRLHNDILVGRSDKGNSTVIMFVKEYEDKMLEMLADRNTYKPMDKDPTKKYQERVNGFAKRLLEDGYIDKTKSKMISIHNAVPPKIYGLRKTHKDTFALRPIVSCINAPCYNLAVFLHEILAPVTTTFKYEVKNSFEFVNSVSCKQIPVNYRLVSLDVVSLFTNIPKNLVVSILSKRWPFISAYTNNPRKLFLEMIEFYFDSSYFLFRGTIYSQLDGSAMGNPLSPVLARFVMDELIGEVLTRLPFDIPFFWLYVDDSFAAVPERDIDSVLKCFNEFHPKLQFTLEKERNCKLSFLDAEVHRTGSDALVLSSRWRVVGAMQKLGALDISDSRSSMDSHKE